MTTGESGTTVPTETTKEALPTIGSTTGARTILKPNRTYRYSYSFLFRTLWQNIKADVRGKVKR